MANWSTQSALREYNMAPNGELTVVERLAALLETGQFADVEIKVGTGDDAPTFKAHRILLATASPSLNSLVTSSSANQSPGETVILNVTDIDPDSFQHILRYIYTDDVDISSISEAIDLLTYSEKWGLESLSKKTVKYMNQYLDEFRPTSEETKNDLCHLTIWTEDEHEKLNTRCWEVLVNHANEVVPCEGFLNMSEKMVRQLLTNENFNYKNQLLLFEAIRDWGMNQVLKQNLHVDKLQAIIRDLLQLINLEGIKDGDFINTILPSECLGKADLISYFMSHGLEIPRDLAFNNNQQISTMMKIGSVEKASRFKRGYKVPDKEIYREHELRFRVDKNVVLLGVAFGFLFSNTDMGINVHCQGPWERSQWSNIVQTYCRVSWEKMRTADIRLMFSEPVHIEANHSYKIMVRIGRMTAGASEVDLWGGGQGLPSVRTKDAEFYFLKNAVDPQKQVEEKDTDNQPSMITDLIYELESKERTKEDSTALIRKTTPPRANVTSPIQSPTYTPHSTIKSPIIPTFSPPSSPVGQPFSSVKSPLIYTSSSPFSPGSKPFSPSANTDSPPQSPNPTQKPKLPELTPKKSFFTQLSREPDPEPAWVKRKASIASDEEGKAPSSPFRTSRETAVDQRVTLPWQRKSSLTKKDELTSYTLKSNPITVSASKTRLSGTTTLPWSIPSRYKPSTSSNISTNISTREPSISKTREPSTPRTREYTPYSSRIDNISRIGTTSKLGSSYQTTTPYSSYKTPGLSTSTRFGQATTTPSDYEKTTSRYGNSIASPYSSTTSRYGQSVTSSKNNLASPYSSSSSRYGQSSITNKVSSPNAYSSSSSRYGQSSATNKASSPSPYSSSSSRYGQSALTNKESTGSSTRFGQTNLTSREPTSSISRYGQSKYDSSGSKYGHSILDRDSAAIGSRTGQTGSTYKSLYSQPSSTAEQSSKYGKSNMYDKETTPGSARFERSYANLYKPATTTSTLSKDGDTPSYKKEVDTISSRIGNESRLSAYSRASPASPFSTRVSSIASRYSGTAGSGSSNYYRR